MSNAPSGHAYVCYNMHRLQSHCFLKACSVVFVIQTQAQTQLGTLRNTNGNPTKRESLRPREERPLGIYLYTWTAPSGLANWMDHPQRKGTLVRVSANSALTKSLSANNKKSRCSSVTRAINVNHGIPRARIHPWIPEFAAAEPQRQAGKFLLKASDALLGRLECFYHNFPQPLITRGKWNRNLVYLHG
eukprot:5966863-Pyramimonas_sp.AAC.1